MDGEEIAKNYLLTIRELSRKRETTRERLERIRARLENPAIAKISPVKVQGGKVCGLQELSELKQEIELKLQEATQAECKALLHIGGMIDNMKDSKHSRLLSLKYEAGSTIKEIADIMGYTTGHIYCMHREALKEFFEKYLNASETLQNAL